MWLLQPGRRQLGPGESYGVSLEVFAHGRHYPNGPNRLVEVCFSATEFVVGTDKPFAVIVAEVPSALFRISEHWENPHPLSFILPPSEPLKLFAGQADAADESHFTIAYSTPAGRGTIDGWLQPDDTVRMQVRDGPAK
ncbi:MAG: hypothetical protein JWP03_5196 [Phycisphaerales bacterium]|nr:hypothetical protein [Phycisphaerales bacterium]